MGTHPLNLAFRFVLELSALASLASFGWARFDGVARWLSAFGFPMLFMVLWGVFAVPDDPSRSGNAPVPVAGSVRLVVELGLFGAAALALYFGEHPRLAVALAASVIVHYMLSWDRIAWLLGR